MRRRSINRHISTSAAPKQSGSLQRRLETLTSDALAFLVDGVMRRGRGVNRTAQLLRFLVGCRLYELNR